MIWYEALVIGLNVFSNMCYQPKAKSEKKHFDANYNANETTVSRQFFLVEKKSIPNSLVKRGLANAIETTL